MLFRSQWTGSGFQIPDLTSSVSNRYAVTFPKASTPAGSYLQFAVGRFTGSAITTNADIIIGFWAKPDTFAQAPASEVYNIFSLGLNPDASNYPGIAIYKPINTYDLIIRAADSVNNTAVSTLQIAGLLDGGGGSQATQYIPQWHHYGFVVQKASSTSVTLRADRKSHV